MEDIKKSDFTLVDYLKIFSEHRKRILTITLIAGLISAILVFFIMDPIFLSTGVVKSISKSGGLGGMLSAGIPDIGDLSEITGAGGSTAKELALYENILTSRRCIEETIIKFNLMEEWDTKYMQDAVKLFRQTVMEIKNDKIAGIMEIGVFDKDPMKAKEIADFLIYQLNKISAELNVQNAKNNREFIEKRYNIVKQDLKNSEDSLKEFQNKFGVAPDVTVKAAVQSEIMIETEIKSEELKLDLLKKILSPNESEILSQQEKINLLKNQLNEIRNSSVITDNLVLKGAPDMVMTYYRLQRDIDIQNKILTFILPLFEQSKIEENKETPTVIVLDYPNVPEKKVKPKRLTIVFFTLIFTFLISLVITILYKRIRIGYKTL